MEARPTTILERENDGPSWRITMGATAITMGIVAIIMGYVLYLQLKNYDRLLADASSSIATQGVLILAFSRALDAAVIKTCSLFVAFLLVFLGGIYTLRVAESAYKVSFEGGATRGMLETASPGLVMLTLGAFLVAVTLWKEHSIDFATAGPPVPGDGTNVTGPEATAPVEKTHLESATVGPGLTLSLAFSEDDVRAITTAMGVVVRRLPNLSPEENQQWISVRDRMDGIRKLIALSKYPLVADKYASIVLQSLTNPSIVDTLPPEQADQFRAVQRLLSETLSPR